MITSRSGEQFKYLQKLKKQSAFRLQEGCFFAEGERLVSEAPAGALLRVYVSETYEKTHADRPERFPQAEVMSDSVFAELCDTRTPQGVLAVVRRQTASPEEVIRRGQTPLLIITDRLQDPGNLGTILRSAEAAGATGILMSADTVDLYNPKVVRATMGTIYRLPAAVTETAEEAVRLCRAAGVRTYAADLSASIPYDTADCRIPCAFVIGNEGAGISQAVREESDARVHIPMAGPTESLNAAVAASVLLFEAARQRRPV